LTLSTTIANKISISKIQHGGGGHLKNSKNRNISAMERPILTNFVQLWVWRQPLKFCKFNNPRWWWPPS